MNKSEAICKLHEIADYRLLGPGDWPADPETYATFIEMILELGLYEEIPGYVDEIRTTQLGIELRVDLMAVFSGCWDPFEIPDFLADQGYLDINEADELCELPESEFEDRLHAVVYRVYRQYSGHSKWSN
jgi:hypothetical protein